MNFFALTAVFFISFATLAQAAPSAPASPEVVLQNVRGYGMATASADGRRLAMLGDGELILWDVPSGLKIKSMPLTSTNFNQNGGDGACVFERITFLAGDQKVAVGGTCGNGNQLDQVVDIENGQTIHYGHYTQGKGGYSPDGELLVSQDNEGPEKSAIKLTRVSDGKLIKYQPGVLNSDEFAAKVIFLDMKTVAVCGETGHSWRVHDLNSGKELFTVPNAECSLRPSISQDRQFVIYQTWDTWDKAYIPMLLKVEGGVRTKLLPQHNNDALEATSARFIEGGHQVELRGINTQTKYPYVATMDIATLQTVSFVSADKALPEDIGETYPLLDGKWAVSNTPNSGFALWDADKAKLLRTFGYKLKNFSRSVWSPDSKLLAIAKEASEYRPKMNPLVSIQFQIWDMSTGRLKHNIQFQTENIPTDISFSPDNSQLLWTNANKGITTFDLKSGRFGTMFADKHVDHCQISPDGKWLVAQNSHQMEEKIGEITVYEYPSGREAANFEGDRLQFSRDGSKALVLIANTHEHQWSRDGMKLLENEAGSVYPVLVGKWKFGEKLFTTTGAISTNPDFTLWADFEYRFGDTNFYVCGKDFYACGKKHTRILRLQNSTAKPIFSPNGEFMLLPDENYIQTLYSTNFKGNKLQALNKLHAFDGGEIDESYLWSPDNNFLAEIREGAILLRNGNTGEPIADLIALDQSESVAVLPSGEYLATKGAMRAVGFRVGMTPYTFEQFDLKYNRPDVVLKALGKAPQRLIDAARRAYEKRLARAGFTEAMLATDFHLPEVAVKREGLPVSTSSPTVTLNISAKDSQVTLDRLLVTVNDVPFDGRIAGIDLKAANSKQANRTVEVPILSGSNRIQASVLNAQGVESYRETVEVRGDMPAVPGKVYALTIGVSQYQNAEYNLRYAAKDAKDVGALFGKMPRSAGATITPVLDTDATRTAILDAKKALLEAGPNDEVVVFLAGHGMLDDKLDYYFATTDIDFDHPATSGLSYDDIENLLDGVKARRKLLLMDTCNSGELDKGDMETTTLAQNDAPNAKIQVRAVGSRSLRRNPAALGQSDLSAFLADLFADTRRGSGAVAISSAGGAEYALESDEWNNGVFTYALLEGLKSGSADKNKDGAVTASELRDTVQTRVQTLTQGKQTPTSRRENLAVDFAVY
ncbi:MAG: caspase family protein [Sideroxydans sp.]|nr:caspase family protein [Sideroxydans sp.]